MTDETYNGFSNWETSNVSLWLSNDEGIYLNTIDLLSKDYKYNHQRFKALKDYVSFLIDSEIITDKISIHRVDFKEVAEGFSEESDKIILECSKRNS